MSFPFVSRVSGVDSGFVGRGFMGFRVWCLEFRGFRVLTFVGLKRMFVSSNLLRLWKGCSAHIAKMLAAVHLLMVPGSFGELV